MKNPEIARQLWSELWQDYRQRVRYARVYQEMIESAGGSIANDHIAFRSLCLKIGDRPFGIAYLEPIIESLGYRVGGEYHFPATHLYARHYSHPEQDSLDLPKLFISELIVSELPAEIASSIESTVLDHPANTQNLEFVKDYLKIFTRPWSIPSRSVVEAVNQVSQYGAWVLLHGYSVNHFTGYVNRQNTPVYADIESTARGLSDRGVPMKDTVEGDRGTGLRQTATRAITETVTVKDDATGESIEIPWTYAYYEIAERNAIRLADGREELFQGFLDAQAKNLFEMTKQ
ncbi:DUF1338 domain-containing protein [Pannus brasiliensis CCIBt3594]|uniref:2-oxoadipate dioxygenase/decarboxylase n=1 Tax=Pannus brasiliensis CCIBt3594 TaxID=1427578 RepID=A0AAW9QFK2_9CHRO